MLPILLFLGGGVALLVAALASAWDDESPSDDRAPPEPYVVTGTGGSGIPLTDDEVEALARVIASEAGTGTPAEQRAVGWVCRNRFLGKSIYKVQHPWRAQRGTDPPFSSARPATDAHRRLAREILAADQADDPTGGATAFFEPRMQDAFAQAGARARAGETGALVVNGVRMSDITRFKNYRKDALQVRSTWSPGSTLYATAGRFELWGNAQQFARRGGTVRAIAGEGVDPHQFTDADREAVARAVESSCPRGTVHEKQAVAWACRNRAARRGEAPAALLAPEGVYGPRGEGGRDFASTAREPGEISAQVARAVLALPATEDPTGGAVDFWNPGQQRRARLLADAREAVGGEPVQILSEDEARAVLLGCGLRVVGVVGEIELLA